MKYAVKTQSLNPNRPQGVAVNSIWLRFEIKDEDSQSFINDGFIVSSNDDYMSQILNTPIITVPENVTARQMKKALAILGKLTGIESFIANLSEPNKTLIGIEWRESNEFLRANPILNSMAALMGLSQTDLDNIFKYARTL